jgi:GT2 family glycosyltransferase
VDDIPVSSFKTPPLVSIVTLNDESFLEACLVSLRCQSMPCRIKVFDNASTDRTREIARDLNVDLTPSSQNVGFSHGHNLNLIGEEFETVLFLNADTWLDTTFLEVLSDSLSADDSIGIVGGKLRRMNEAGREMIRDGHPILDSTGIYFTPSQRHFDRGSGEPDMGQYERKQLLFGMTGAAMLCRKSMFQDLGFGDECLDSDFFAYREDADLGWRAHLRGWKVLYDPGAKGLHRRCVIPSRRRHLDPLINFHSLKNRYLMRIKNMDSAVRRRCFPYMFLRDAGIFAYVALVERASFPAFREVRRLKIRFLRKRSIIQRGRRSSPRKIASWFAFRPTAIDY